MAKNISDTPMMQQHKEIKKQFPDAILLFRVGDFYETFEQDAITASRILGITLTKRNNGGAAGSDLAGFPHHALDTYLHKLVKAGYRVAICDQLEDPKLAKGLVKRGVTEMVTPGTTTNDKLLENNANNFLAAVHFSGNLLGLSFLDISTGEFFLAEGDVDYADKLLQSLRPSEVIIQRDYKKIFEEKFGADFYTYYEDSWIFDEAFATENLLKRFEVQSLKGFGLDEMHAGIVAAGTILHYLKETQHPDLEHITNIQRIDAGDFLWMDRFTIRNLEIFRNENSKTHCLLDVLDSTVNPMGARLLRRWVVLPLKSLPKITDRLNSVECMVKDPDVRHGLRDLLREIGDIERLAGKIPNKRINPRELLQLSRGLFEVNKIKELLFSSGDSYFLELANPLDSCPEAVQRIMSEISETPPVNTSKGGMIRDGYNQELDDLRSIANGGKDYLNKMVLRESQRTGINNLKIGYNSVFGYYLEVTKSQKEKAPEDWERKQTLVGAERYITQELKDYEVKITGAEEKIQSLEMNLYMELLDFLLPFLSRMEKDGSCLAIVDCLCCFAENALKYKYTKPEVHDKQDLLLKGSRHPVIERALPEGDYIANDITLDPEKQQIIILTGPNMSGKSALLRQTALITLMSHIGSFVPAASAKIPLTDKIFTRVGANDNLSAGESTFMVEMNETASIINNISSRSLILLDEIGRGTSTYDGISIAWSIVEYLHQSPCAPKTLFATHYHELNELENRLPRVKNYHITDKEVGNKIIFLRKLAPGGSTHSFGIHVAQMAGMPQSLIERANEILHILEEKSDDADTCREDQEEVAALNIKENGSRLKKRVKTLSTPTMQLSIFDTQTEVFQSIRQMLTEIDINNLTPVEALLKLNQIKSLIK